MNIRILRIKNRTTGLYAKKGDDSNQWSKKGKVWTQLNHVHSHINLAKINRFEEYLDSDIVELINDKEIIIEPISDYLAKNIDQIISHFQYRVNDYIDKPNVTEIYKQTLQRKLDKAIELKFKYDQEESL